ncbi:Flavohemoprotein [Porphyridium purpureum]|uniref:Flavohemoprotein n=1 Tax=Porphyridium purpureum TaxID=35688 RepID=A0A5J4YXR8_PORPP|nr:Flavohemoprotein [Porphyridium purpureum]|eukprot:POR6699..scf209_3
MSAEVDNGGVAAPADALDERARFVLERATVECVQASWQLLMQQRFPFAQHFYVLLFARHPQLESMFPQNWVARQHHLTDVLNTVVHRLGVFEQELVPVVRALGRRHASYGVTQSMFDQVGECLLETLRKGLRDAADEHTLAAWAQMYGVVAAVASAECPVSKKHSAMCTLWSSDVFRAAVSSNSAEVFCEQVRCPDFKWQVVEKTCGAEELQFVVETSAELDVNTSGGEKGEAPLIFDLTSLMSAILDGMGAIVDKSFSRGDLSVHCCDILLQLSRSGLTASNAQVLFKFLQRVVCTLLLACNVEQCGQSHQQIELEQRFWADIFGCFLQLVEELETDWERLSTLEVEHMLPCCDEESASSNLPLSRARSSLRSNDGLSSRRSRSKSLKSNIIRLHGYTSNYLEPIPDDEEAEESSSSDEDADS